MEETAIQSKHIEVSSDTKARSNWLTAVIVLSAGHFVCDMYVGFLAPSLPLLMENLNFSVAFAGFLAATVSFASSFSQVIFGVLSDRISRRFFVIAGPVISAVFFSMIGYMPNKLMLICCLLSGGIGVAQFHPLAAKMVHQVSNNSNMGKSMSFFVTGGSIGYSLGPLIVTGIIAAWGIKTLPVVVIPAIILALFMFKYAPKHHAAKTSAKVFITKENLKKTKSLMFYVFIGILRSMTILGFAILIPIMFAQQGASIEVGGFAIFIMAFFGGLGVFAGGFLADKFPAKLLITGSFLIGSPVLFAFTVSSGPVALVFLGLAGFLLHSSIPAVITQAQATMPSNMSTVSSMVMGFSWGVGGLMVMVVGKFADIYGILETMHVLALVPLAGVLLSIPLHTKPDSDTKLPEYI